MVNNKILIEEITASDLVATLQVIIAAEIKKLKENQPEKLLSPKETCKLFQPAISKVTLAAWTKNGKLQDFRIGGRVYYKQSEIFAALTILKKYKN